MVTERVKNIFLVHVITMQIYVVRMTRIWNNLHQVRSKSKDSVTCKQGVALFTLFFYNAKVFHS